MTVNSVSFKIKNSKLAEILKNNNVDLAIDDDIIYSNRKGNKTAKWLEIGSEGNVEEAITQSNIADWMLEFLNFMGDVFCGGFSTLSENNVQEAREEIKEFAKEINNATTEFEIKICCCSDEGFDNSFETYNFADGKFVSTYVSEFDYEKRVSDDRPFCTAIMEEGPEGIEEILFGNTQTLNIKNANTTSQKHSSNKEAATNDEGFEIFNNVLQKYAGPGGEVIVPDGVVSIDAYVFRDRKDITKVVLPDGVKKIKDSAFCDCDQLVSINLPESLNEIGDYAFSGCSSLEKIILSDGVIEIGKNAFAYCTSLKNIVVPRSVEKIGDSAFYWCEKLLSVSLQSGLLSIGESAFGACKSLVDITIPNSVTTIGRKAFWFCESIENISIPDNVTSIGDGVFLGCKKLLETNEFLIIKNILIAYNGGAKAVIPEGVIKIGEQAFAYNISITDVEIPNSVVEIGDVAFSECSNLKSVYIPDSVTCIGRSAFAGCENLTDIKLPNGITHISDGMLNGCNELKEIFVPKSVKSIGDFAFNECRNLTSITIPNEETTIGEYVLTWYNKNISRIIASSDSVYKKIWGMLETEQKNNVLYSLAKEKYDNKFIVDKIKRAKNKLVERAITDDEVCVVEYIFSLQEKISSAELNDYRQKASNAPKVFEFLSNY